ncbi:hypothetical protein LG299_08985 [Microbacterium lacus]|uniref:hypothetical protein n=1 Tax=Microbacterium lacus TaxID=415217 RepID=UPI00384CF68C
MTDQPNKRPAFEPAQRLLRPTGYDPEMKRPASTVTGFVLVLLRVVAGIIVLSAAAAGWGDATIDIALDDIDLVDPETTVLWIVLITGAVVLLIDAVLAIFIFRGHNWARVLIMFVAVISISTTFIAWAAHEQAVTLEGTFLSIGLDVLLLLALSSRSAAAYARRNERR